MSLLVTFRRKFPLAKTYECLPAAGKRFDWNNQGYTSCVNLLASLIVSPIFLTFS